MLHVSADRSRRRSHHTRSGCSGIEHRCETLHSQPFTSSAARRFQRVRSPLDVGCRRSATRPATHGGPTSITGTARLTLAIFDIVISQLSGRTQGEVAIARDRSFAFRVTCE